MQSAITEWREGGKEGGMDGGRRNPRGCRLFFSQMYLCYHVCAPISIPPPTSSSPLEERKLVAPVCSSSEARRGEQGQRSDTTPGW